jgi:electron transfer flavoprotein alpha/beta subunit
MTRVAVIIGSASSGTHPGASALPMSDRGAVALAMVRFGPAVCAYASDSDARCFARAAGVATVEEISNLEINRIDVALIGRGGCGECGDALPARLAEEIGAALVYDVLDVQLESDRLVVTRDLGRGARDVLGVRGRAVLVVADSVVRGPYVSRYRIDAEKAASGDSPAPRTSSDVGWKLATPRVRLGDCASRVAGRAVERMNALFGLGEIAENDASLVRGSPAECARHLCRYLSHHGFIEPGLGGAQERASEGAVTSRPAEGRHERSVTDAASIPIRVRRRPRPVDHRSLAMRGPFEVGVDL